MSFRVIHHEGDKDLLIEKIKATADQLKNDEFKDDFDFGDDKWWERAVDSVVNGDFGRYRSDTERISLVLFRAIETFFPAASEDCFARGYEDLADRTSGKLAETLRMFVEGRNFSTGKMGCGLDGEITCGYLSADEVREFLELLKAYSSSAEDSDEFVDELIETFTPLVEKNSGALSIMS